MTAITYSLTEAQTYLIIAAVFRRFNFEFFETTIENVTVVRDSFNGQRKRGLESVRVKVLSQNK